MNGLCELLSLINRLRAIAATISAPMPFLAIIYIAKMPLIEALSPATAMSRAHWP